MSSEKNILVCGATGKQGGAVAQSLLKRGHQVFALVRDLNKEASLKLKEAGAHLVQGNYNDIASLKKALNNIHSLFSVQNFFEVGYEKEIEQGCQLADLAEEAGVKHLVYSSVIGADRYSNIPHFESKWQIEKYLKTKKLNVTVLRAVAYMDNWFTYNWYNDNKLYVPMKADRKWQMIASRDIGEFAAIAFADEQKYKGRALEIAGDEFTMPEAAKTFSKVLNHQVEYVEQPMAELRKFSEELALMFEWFNDKANYADLNNLRQIHPQLWNLEQWLKHEASVAPVAAPTK